MKVEFEIDDGLTPLTVALDEARWGYLQQESYGDEED